MKPLENIEICSDMYEIIEHLDGCIIWGKATTAQRYYAAARIHEICRIAGCKNVREEKARQIIDEGTWLIAEILGVEQDEEKE